MGRKKRRKKQQADTSNTNGALKQPRLKKAKTVSRPGVVDAPANVSPGVDHVPQQAGKHELSNTSNPTATVADVKDDEEDPCTAKDSTTNSPKKEISIISSEHTSASAADSVTPSPGAPEHTAEPACGAPGSSDNGLGMGKKSASQRGRRVPEVFDRTRFSGSWIISVLFAWYCCLCGFALCCMRVFLLTLLAGVYFVLPRSINVVVSREIAKYGMGWWIRAVGLPDDSAVLACAGGPALAAALATDHSYSVRDVLRLVADDSWISTFLCGLVGENEGGVLSQGECVVTNGSHVLSFIDPLLMSAQTVQPVAIRVWNAFPVHHTLEGCGVWNMLAVLLTPFVTVDVVYLPTVKRRPTESQREMLDRIQEHVACELGVPSSAHSALDLTDVPMFHQLSKFIHTKTWEPRSKAVAHVTFVHGLGEHIGRYEHVFSAFASQGIRVSSFDQRGFGQSSGRRGAVDCEHTLRCVKRLVDCKQEVPHFLMGHSMGGMYVLTHVAMCGSSNLAGVIASAPLIKQTVPAHPLQRAVVEHIAPWLGSATVDNGLDVNDISRDPREVQRYKADPLVHRRISLKGAVDIIQRGEALLTTIDTRRFSAPLLLVHGDNDAITSPVASRQFFEHIKGASTSDKTFHTVPGGYHELHNDPNKDVLIAEYMEWILEKAAAS